MYECMYYVQKILYKYNDVAWITTTDQNKKLN